MILEEGLDAFTVEAVASASGSARSTIYRHWPEPRDLLIDSLSSMSRHFPIPDTGALDTDLVAFFEALRPILDDPKTRRLLLDVTRLAIEDPALERIRFRALAEQRQPVQVILQRAIARGEIDADLDMSLALHLVEGPLISASIMQNTPMTDEAVRALVERILRALG